MCCYGVRLSHHRHFHRYLSIIFFTRQISSDPTKFSRQAAGRLVRVRCLIDNRARVSREKRLSRGKLRLRLNGGGSRGNE